MLLYEFKYKDEFTQKNAKQEVPVLEIDGLELTQSVGYIIFDYAVETNA